MNRYNVISSADIPFEDGTTPRERNNALSHVITLGSKVCFWECNAKGISEAVEGFVLAYCRNCDGTPLYMVGERFSLIEEYQEADKKYHELQELLKVTKPLSRERYDLRDKSDEQMELMYAAFKDFNNRYSKDSLDVLENATKEQTDICNRANIIWGNEFHKRLDVQKNDFHMTTCFDTSAKITDLDNFKFSPQKATISAVKEWKTPNGVMVIMELKDCGWSKKINKCFHALGAIEDLEHIPHVTLEKTSNPDLVEKLQCLVGQELIFDKHVIKVKGLNLNSEIKRLKI